MVYQAKMVFVCFFVVMSLSCSFVVSKTCQSSQHVLSTRKAAASEGNFSKRNSPVMLLASRNPDKLAARQKLDAASTPIPSNVLVSEAPKKKKDGSPMEIALCISLWYFMSIFYNIYNKKSLNILKMPWLVATIQMGLGLPIFISLWAFRLREFPAHSFSEFKEQLRSLSTVAWYQTLTHIAGVIALGAGSVSFLQIMKAAEPAFTALLSAVFERQIFPLPVYLTLIPVIGGVSMASVSELSFSWNAFYTGVFCNVFAAARGVFGKKQMCGETRCVEKMSPENYYAVLTLLSFFMCLPPTLLLEGSQIAGLVLNDKTIAGLLYATASGILFYLYNEVSFRALSNLHPVSHALANTLKRIVIIVSSVWVFRNPMTWSGIIGSTLAILGVCAYSLAQYYSKSPKKDEVKAK